MHDRWAWEWTAARRWMTQEVIAATEAAFKHGYDEVIVADGHGSAHSIDPDALPENVRLIRSWPRPMLQMQGIEQPGVDACAFVGYHAPATTAGSVIAHTFSGATYRAIRLNGEDCSEGYFNAAFAGERGIPIIFVSGDDLTIADARRYAPEAELFVTKQACGWRSQMSLPPAQVCARLKDAFAKALQRPKPRPFIVSGPFHLEFELTTQVAAEMLAYLPNVERLGAFGVATTFSTMEMAMRFLTFAMLYTPNGAPPF